ncbi:hypothetical protein HMPREF0758_5086 [Serratia odorifera DSM 4582]|uniref:Conjugal transfer protein TraE n=2 Tax=Serratia odorifera TaxID=618 RepID=D4EA86_SEROD|nr:hypothetical protein HMPREF0758_5086 [Serratia odorifera DSM 4582]
MCNTLEYKFSEVKMHSLLKIVQSLITSGNSRANERNTEVEEGPKEITSIRLKPQTRAYLQVQSETLGISVSQLINIMIDGVVELETAPRKNEIDSLYDRLMMLFESHKISPLDMSLMLHKYGVTLSKIKSRDIMLDLITPEMLKEVSSWFGTNLTWLNGTSEEIYSRSIDWYKNPDWMILAIIDRLIKYRKVDVYALKREGIEFSEAEHHDTTALNLSMGFVIKYKHTVDNVTFDRYELCEFQRWNYVVCRDGLKDVFRGLYELEKRNQGASLYGYSIEDNILDKLSRGRIFPSQLETTMSKNGLWYPEDQVDSMSLQSKIAKYVEAYSSLPSKHFYENDNDDHCSKRWHISVFQSGESKFEYHYLKDGLNDLYEKFHTINDEECQ